MAQVYPFAVLIPRFTFLPLLLSPLLLVPEPLVLALGALPIVLEPLLPALRLLLVL